MDNFSTIRDSFIAPEAPEQKLDSIAARVREFWSIALTARLIPEQKMLSSVRRVNGEYDPDKLSALNEMGMSTDFMRLTFAKCRDAESHITDTLDPLGDRLWDIEIDGTISIPPDIKAAIGQQIQMQIMQQSVMQMQAAGLPVDQGAIETQIMSAREEIEKYVLEQARAYAEERCTNMENLIVDQFRQGGWGQSLKACLNDFTRKQACIIRGPLPEKHKIEKWLPDQATSQYTYQEAEVVIPCWSRISPFDWYPGPNSIGIDDGDAIELEHFNPSDFTKMLGLPGYNDAAIREILHRFPNGHTETTVIDNDRRVLERDDLTGSQNNIASKIDCLNYWGEIPGKLLLEWGIGADEITDPDISYQVNVKMVDTIVFRVMVNPDPLGRKPYGVSSFSKSNDSQWGESPADLMECIQNICNTTIRAIVNNEAMAAGPVVEVDQDRLAVGETADIHPWKTFTTTNKKSLDSPAVRFYQANLLAKDLLGVYDRFKKEADEMVVPAFDASATKQKTASGMAMAQGASYRNIKLAIKNFYEDIIIPSVQRQFTYNMLFIDDPMIKGTLHVVARDANAQMVREQMAVRLNEFLQMTNNPTDMQIVDIKGRAYGLGAAAKALRLDAKQLIPNLSAIEKSSPGPLPMLGAPSASGQQQGMDQRETTVSGEPAGGTDQTLFQRKKGV